MTRQCCPAARRLSLGAVGHSTGGILVIALRQQGWSISAIARHLGVDRKTVRLSVWRA